MTTPSNAIPEAASEARAVAHAAISPGRVMYWAVRRELWESRSLYLAPLAVATVILVGFLLGIFRLAGRLRAASTLSPEQLHQLITQPYNFAALLLMATSVVVAVFYCLDALYGERRDRSILFWKSLPVSDVTTVVSKAAIPLVVIPLVTLAITIVVQLLMLAISALVLLGGGVSVSAWWAHLPLAQMWLMLLYHYLAVHALWYAPFYGWLFLVSAWARRAPILWAVLPPLAIAMVERIAFNTSHFTALLQHRLIGGPEGEEFTSAIESMHPLMHLTPGQFLASPGLWIGLALTAALLFAAARVRRYRGPV